MLSSYYLLVEISTKFSLLYLVKKYLVLKTHNSFSGNALEIEFAYKIFEQIDYIESMK